MKRLLLLTMAMVFSLINLQSQTVVWEEDFGDGMRGWSTQSDQCGRNFGNVIGSYELTSITVNGAAVTGVTGEFNILNSLEYTVNFDDGTNYGTVYARYTLANDIMDSNLDLQNVTRDGRSVTADNFRFNNSSTVMDVSQEAFDTWVPVLTGIADPTATLSGSVLTLTSGNTVVTLTNNGVCAGLFHYSADGGYGTVFTQGSDDPRVFIGSETAANGAMVFNAVMQTWLEDDANLDVLPSEYPEYTTSLISPDIDISNASGALALEFTQAVLYLNVSDGARAVPITETFSRQVRTAFEVSTDGGANWSDPIQLNEEIESNSWFETREAIPIPSGVVGGASTIKIRFTFGSDFYFWVLDDIQIVERAAYDMQINENFFAVYNNFATPISQADSAAFLADIQNNGGLDANNVQLNLTITAEDGTEVYNDTKDYGTIVIDSIAENQLFDAVLDPADLDVGAYLGQYLISHDEEDSNLFNDTLFFQFVMTDTTFAKENGRNVSGIAPADDVSYSFGNIFYMPNGEGFVARNVSFAVDNADELAGRSINIYLYEWNGDANNDGFANSSEYGNAIALNSYTFSGNEPANELITTPFDFEGNDIPLKDNTHYIVLLQYINSSGDGQDCRFVASGNIDYSASTFANALAGLERPPVVLNVGPEPTPDLALASFVGNPVPVVRMSIGQTVNTPNVLSEENKIKVYPNPTNRDINLEVALVNTSSKVQISVMDAAGRMLQRNSYNNFKEGKFNYDLSNLSAGFYFIRILTDEGLRTEKIFLQQ